MRRTLIAREETERVFRDFARHYLELFGDRTVFRVDFKPVAMQVFSGVSIGPSIRGRTT